MTRTKAPKKPNGFILYEGPSALDGAPIVVIVTGLKTKSRNEKTGSMVTTWIMRSDVAPSEALKTGQDASVCGMCPFRPALGGVCYVTVWQAPRSIWAAYKRGAYQPLSLADAADACEGRLVRLGSYGDPAAAPVAAWEALVSKASGWTGYTHQWRSAPDAFKRLTMASADNAGEGFEARAAGWRTFRIRDASEPVAPKLEFICPASKEAGYKTDCASCRACMGTDSKAKASPVIIVHGAGKAKRFTLTRNGAPVTLAA
jgi:hypothetical protein